MWIVKLALRRYEAGLVTYLEITTAENASLVIQRTATRLRGQQIVAAISLIKSLGGSWNLKTNGNNAVK